MRVQNNFSINSGSQKVNFKALELSSEEDLVKKVVGGEFAHDYLNTLDYLHFLSPNNKEAIRAAIYKKDGAILLLPEDIAEINNKEAQAIISRRKVLSRNSDARETKADFFGKNGGVSDLITLIEKAKRIPAKVLENFKAHFGSAEAAFKTAEAAFESEKKDLAKKLLKSVK